MRSLFPLFAGLCLGASAALAQPAPGNPLAHDQPKFDRAAAEYDAGHYEAAYKLFLELADDNDIAAARNVALMKRKGLGCVRDPQGALDYMTQAAEGGLATAAADLADMLLDGEAGPPDAKAALPWLEAAAKAGHPRAQFRLGEMFETGDLVPKDLNEAMSLYGEAAAAGMPGASERLEAVKAMAAAQSGTSSTETTPAAATDATTRESLPEAGTAPPPAPQGAASLASRFVLQIGAYRSEAEALEAWRAYKMAHTVAADFEPDVRQADVPGKGTWYRLRIGSFESAAEASVLCAKLKATGGDCFPARR